MKRLIKILSIGLVMLGLTSCNKDLLNLKPTNDITADEVYKDLDGYKRAFVKIYASFALTGGGGAGSGDLGGIDAGQSDFLRLYWNIQQLTSDETLCAWNDPGIPDMNFGMPASDNVMIKGLYARSIYQITLANEFLRESTEAKLNSRNIPAADREKIAQFRTEARFLRAYQYWILIDLFGNPIFVTEDNVISKNAPKQIFRADLFAYIESELLEIQNELADPKTNEYGRADKAVAWTLLAKLYLNAEVYLGKGKGKYTEAVTYAKKVIDAGYQLAPIYKNLFLIDNNVTSKSEIIFTINYDGEKSQNFGGTTFIINSLINADMNPGSYGVPSGGWGGNRAVSLLPTLFNTADKRAMFYGDKADNEEYSLFTDGLAITKFKNMSSTGTAGASHDGTFSSLDFPLMRLADVYLMYAEAILRGGTGVPQGDALIYFNKVRERAYGNTSGNLTTVSLDDILDERSRELYFEGYRRTDLIRFEKFTGSNYLWPWKGGLKEGKAIESFRTLLPIPSSEIIANPNITPNPGY
ncbi:RagB/SusD family nutrient uptake outer membrane protein [Pseudopedobacter beijingensis]|uniref:RagB/SusD family nutrient uptake outer membrane protein n=1 Tax=Pseudopedobacter beijingensis TaxID=1207056 RepID=A0ABW4I9K1_9SPHI